MFTTYLLKFNRTTDSMQCVIDEQIIAAAKDVEEKQNTYAPYKILPLDSAGASQSIMQLELKRQSSLLFYFVLLFRVGCDVQFVDFPFYQVKAAVAALLNTGCLNRPPAFQQHRRKTNDLDLFFDWLRAMFRFQACSLVAYNPIFVFFSADWNENVFGEVTLEVGLF